MFNQETKKWEGDGEDLQISILDEDQESKRQENIAPPDNQQSTVQALPQGKVDE